jgi:uncharacterized protein YutE (UPF0331/DUF86 family)
MTSLNVIENKISAVNKYLTILKHYQKYSLRQIESSLDLRGAVERYLYLAAQATIDLAEAVIAYKHYRKPATQAEAFRILNEEGIIKTALTAKMIQMTGFRNIIAHDYGNIEYDIVFQVLHQGAKDIKSFVKCVKDLI